MSGECLCHLYWECLTRNLFDHFHWPFASLYMGLPCSANIYRSSWMHWRRRRKRRSEPRKNTVSDLGPDLFFPRQCLKVQLSCNVLEKHVLVPLCMCVLSYLVCKVAVGPRPAACEALQKEPRSYTPHRILDTTSSFPARIWKNSCLTVS